MQLFQLSSFDFSSKYSKGRRISNVCDFPPCIFTVLLRYSQQTPRVFLTGNRIHIQMWFPSASLSVSLALLLCAHTLHETDKEAVGNHICICIRSPVIKTLGVCWLLHKCISKIYQGIFKAFSDIYIYLSYYFG